jgi:mannose-6-phosphate isomerase-like protein (cupin superfamily)
LQPTGAAILVFALQRPCRRPRQFSPSDLRHQKYTVGTTERSCVIHLTEAQVSVPGPAGEHAVSVFQRGTLKAMISVGRFTSLPRPTTPHAQDEVYVIIRGHGFFLHDGKRDPFGPGDLLFVAAGIEHRFEDFTDDLTVWVVFYGPTGGEVLA